LGKNVKVLAQLQEIDLRIDSARGEKQALQEGVHSLERRVEEMRLDIAGQNAELETVEGEKRALEENLTTETEAITRSEARLRDIKTQKEYQAVSKEIAAAKKVKSEVEEQILQKITRSDELKAVIGERERVLQELEATAAGQKDELLGQIQKLDAIIDENLASREVTAQVISPSMIKKYTMLRDRRQGIAIVEARNGSCLGCNMNLPPQLFNSLFKRDSLIACPHCQRLLFLRPEGENSAI
jgi:predicted  nucleic acid-binding Zn-ribbon protein